MPIEYQFAPRDETPTEAPQLDASQQAVVDHPGGPLLVLAGPGTGKTTTLIETVVDRIDNRGVSPDEVLVLTFSRKAAEELRTRISGRLARTTTTALAMTFHSFCYGLVREFQDPEAYCSPLRLLSAPEQDSMISELISGTSASDWPKSLQPALRTRGFAAELQDLMATARSMGMDPDTLKSAGASARRDDWVATGRFFDEYADVSGFANTIDYSALVAHAVRIAQDPDCQSILRKRFRLVVVDEYQDTDPLQVALLKAIAGDGRDLIAVGDPDQSIYAFRGADVRGVFEFPTDFATASGPAPMKALGSTRRFGNNILAASRAIIAKSGVTGHLDHATFREFRDLTSLADNEGAVTVQTYATPAAEAENLALLLSEAHLRDKVPWNDMAVLVRSGRASLPRLQRAFVAAGVPVEVAGDEVPLAAEPAVRSLLTALRVAETIANESEVSVEQAETVLTGPLCRLDAPSLRRLGRVLRADSTSEDRPPQPSGRLLAQALSDPVSLRMAGHSDHATSEAASRAHHLAQLLCTAAKEINDRVAPEQVLWTLWDGTDWSNRLWNESQSIAVEERADAERSDIESSGDEAGRADQDLDALCALFSRAARSEEQQKRQTISAFVTELEAQQIPADTLSDRGVGRDAVRLMTAHRSKGLEWPLVVVAGVQDGVWPDIRHRGTLLQAERLGTDGEVPASSAASLLAEERRLFYVACTRAGERLVVTAVESSSDSGDQPSRFLLELEEFCAADRASGNRIAQPAGRPTRPLSLRGAIAELRTTAESSESPVVRNEAAETLARLASEKFWSTRGAHPSRWWGVADLTVNETPMILEGQQIGLSASTVSSIETCPLQWFFDRKVHASSGTTSAQGFGSIVHALAADVIDQISVDPASLTGQLEKVWDQLQFAAPWIGRRERANAHEAITRFARWHSSNQRNPLEAEHEFKIEFDAGTEIVILHGWMDRVEIDDLGRVHVVDLKTSKSAPSKQEIETEPQLGFYQLVVNAGGTEELAPGAPSGGAELVQLRTSASASTPELPKVQSQASPSEGEPFFALEQLQRAVHTIRDEDFQATPSTKACQFCKFRGACPAQPEGATIFDGGQS